MDDLVKFDKDGKLIVAGIDEPVDGVQGFDQQDFTIPRIRLLQAVSAEVQDGVAQPGTLCNSLTGDSYGSEIEFVPLSAMKQRLMFQDKTRVCFSPDGLVGDGMPGGRCDRCAMSAWGSDRTPPPCSLVYVYPSMIIVGGKTESMPVAVSLMRSSSKAARQLNTMLRFSSGLQVYKLRVIKKESPKGKFYALEVALSRPMTDDEKIAAAQLRQTLRAAKNVEVEFDSGEFDSNPEGTGEPF